ncbi:MAG TPA: hypothetical protein VGQ53_08785 [Chitinophagaceae bacterium]|jgi:hypothetical protein|nr:hypothetical protein [Chitinophagaceae bacterium]
MKKNVMFMLLAFVTLNLTARTPAGGPDPGPAVFSKSSAVRVSPLVEARFKKQYGPVVNVSWKVIEDISIATFTEQGTQTDVFYYNDGDTFGYGKSVDKNVLPKAVSGSLNKKFSEGTVQKAYEFKTPDSPTRYYVRVIAPNYSVIASATEFGDVTVYQKQKIK